MDGMPVALFDATDCLAAVSKDRDQGNQSAARKQLLNDVIVMSLDASDIFS
jgi:hypothetical protein